MNINISAPCNQLGMGIVGQSLIAHLDDNINVSFFPIGPVEPSEKYQKFISKGLENRVEFDKHATSIRYWHPHDMAHHVGQGQRVGYTIFESNKLNKQSINDLNSQDLLLVPSKWAKKVIIDNGITTKVDVVNHGIDPTIFYPTPIMENAPTTFYITGKWEVRKGHYEAITAFNKAFEKTDNVRLVVHCYNTLISDSANREWHDYCMRSKLMSKIDCVWGRYATQESVAETISKVHCGIFMNRAEGWNLPLCEVLAMGRHAIATDYSAHTEYLTPSCAKLININKLEPAFDGRWFFGDGEWAKLGNEEIDQLIWHMRFIHNKNKDGNLKLNLNGIERMKDFTWNRVCEDLIYCVTK